MRTIRSLWGTVTFWLLTMIIFSPVIVQAQESRPVIVISPGHGWGNGNSDKVDPGVSNDDLFEKDINLEVARFARTYLARCPVDVYLTRDGDDPSHTLEDVDDIVNSYHPTLGVSIHTNSFQGTQTGTEGWYTVGGFNDEGSQKLASLLSGNIAARLGIRNIGIKQETQNRHGGLYIHHWDAPSALIEIAEIHGDADLLIERTNDFGRSIAQGILEYLGVDPHCADGLKTQGFFVSTYFPKDTIVNDITLVNDSLTTWQPEAYSLICQGNKYGAEAQYSLPIQTPVDGIVTWNIPVVAPSKPGIFRQEWQLSRGTQPIGKKVTIYIIVVPEDARELKENVDRRIEEIRERGEEEIEKLIQQLEQEALDWVKRQILEIDCFNNITFVALTFGAIALRHRRRKPSL